LCSTLTPADPLHLMTLLKDVRTFPKRRAL